MGTHADSPGVFLVSFKRLKIPATFWGHGHGKATALLKLLEGFLLDVPIGPFTLAGGDSHPPHPRADI